MAEVPAASFTKVEGPKPKGLERVKKNFSPEKRRERREEKAAERRKRSVPEARVEQIKKERGRKGRALNLEADGAFSVAVHQEKQKAIAQHSLSAEIQGNQHQFSPSELADIQSRAFAELAKSSANAQLLDYYRREGLYFSKPDHNGNCTIDHQADPFRRAVEQQAQELRSTGSDTEANNVLDSFARDCRVKAEMYAAAGDKGMQEALQRIRPMSIDATPAVNGQAKAVEAAPATVNLAEQQLKTDLARYAELSAIAPASMTFAQKNEMRHLHKAHEAQIASAQILADKFNNDTDMILQQADLDRLELYKAFLKTPDATLPAPNTPSPAELQAKQRAQEAAYIQQHGPDSFTQLTALNIDFSNMTEDQVLAECRKARWTGPDSDVKTFIHAGYEENTRIQNEMAKVSTLPPDKMAIVDDIQRNKKLPLSELATLIAFFLAEMAKSAITVAPAVP